MKIPNPYQMAYYELMAMLSMLGITLAWGFRLWPMLGFFGFMLVVYLLLMWGGSR